VAGAGAKPNAMRKKINNASWVTKPAYYLNALAILTLKNPALTSRALFRIAPYNSSKVQYTSTRGAAVVWIRGLTYVKFAHMR
jgi:hypothetical protein